MSLQNHIVTIGKNNKNCDQNTDIDSLHWVTGKKSEKYQQWQHLTNNCGR